MNRAVDTSRVTAGEVERELRPVRFRHEIAFRVVSGEGFLVTADRAMHRVAAPSGVAILEALAARPHSRKELYIALASRFRGDPEQIARDTDVFLTRLVARGVVEEFEGE